MTRLFRPFKGKVGAAPGTVQYHGPRKVEQIVLQVMDMTPDLLEERELGGVEEALAYRDTSSLTWLNIIGLHDIDTLRRIGDHFGLHPLVQEDIVNTHQRPKLEDYEDYLYLVCRMISFDAEAASISTEQVSLVVGPHWILTFQEQPGDVFEGVRQRIRLGKGRIRTTGPAYLAYALLDAVVDSYFVVIERVGDEIESLEERLLQAPEASLLHAIHKIKREMILLRRAVWPLREVAAGCERGDSPLLPRTTRIFFRDLYDHTIQVADAVDSYRDILTGLQDLYLSSVSNRMNEVMKVLTTIGTLFIPLTFLAGIYGMNFEHMPELGWKWSYPVFGVVCVGLITGMLAWFRRRHWF